MAKKSHPWNSGFPKVVNRKMKKPRGDVDAMYTHRIEPSEPYAGAAPQADEKEPRP